MVVQCFENGRAAEFSQLVDIIEDIVQLYDNPVLVIPDDV